MSDDRWVVEFEGEMDEEGRIRVPDHLAREMPARIGALHVRLSGAKRMKELVARGVTDAEVRAVSELQSSREADVFRALAAEGRLRETSFSRRLEGLVREREP
ncbi:MAG TPA: hypothetical protein VMG09_16350 [Bacteroidota bacterium]|nr:hypothetical protein [Bacteroidota bacterium]